ncbi:hypothetical protein S83_046237 [Arachis hypogaea]|nr:Stigma-specific STIG1-like protein [Arachis hypogaea]
MKLFKILFLVSILIMAMVINVSLTAAHSEAPNHSEKAPAEAPNHSEKAPAEAPAEAPNRKKCDEKKVDFTSDRNNCGRCGHKCNHKKTCCEGKCVNLKTNEKHCGKCCTKCTNKQTCLKGTCTNSKFYL